MGLFDSISWNIGKVLGTNSFIDNVFRDPVKPMPGSIIHCDLSRIPCASMIGLKAEHTGVYVGHGMIIHRDGDGYLAKVTPEEFLNRLDGNNYAISVYVSCNGNNPLHLPWAFTRAIMALENPKFEGYDLLNKNCHHFTRYCLTGDLDQWGLDFTFNSLENLLHDKFGMDNWRIWNYKE